LHHDDIGVRRRVRVAQDGPADIAEIAREQHAAPPARFLEFQQDAGRTEDVPGVEEGRTDARRDLERLPVTRDAAEVVQHGERIQDRIQRGDRVRVLAAAPGAMRAAARFFLLQVGGVLHHQARQLARGGGRHDLAAEPAPGQQRQTAAVIQVGMGEQHMIDLRGIEAERLGVLLLQFATALIQAAIDQDAAARAFDHMAGSGHAPVGAMEG
jgi:hypothetical protein